MSRWFRCWVVAAVFAVAVGPRVAHAQVVAGTFGPGDSYDHVNRWSVAPDVSVAEGFTYGGASGATLANVRLALAALSSPYTISFREGSDLNTAVTLESWTRTVSLDGIETFSSVLLPSVSTGGIYWVVAANPLDFGWWYWNDQGYDVVTNNVFNFGWHTHSGPLWPGTAYDVSVTAPTVTPEPATLLLLATGLVGVAGTAMRRRKRHGA